MPQVLDKNAFDKNFGIFAECEIPSDFSALPLVTHVIFHPQSFRQDGREVPPAAPVSQSMRPDLRLLDGSYEGSTSPRKCSEPSEN